VLERLPAGVRKEQYRLRHRDALRDAVWKARQKVATAEAAHTSAQRQGAEIDRLGHRVTRAAESERQAKRQRLAHGGGWHPAAVHAGLAGGASDAGRASDDAALSLKCTCGRANCKSPLPVEKTLQRLERLSVGQHEQERRRFASLGQKQAELAGLEAQRARSQQAPLLSFTPEACG
jgi:hypothetical protein